MPFETHDERLKRLGQEWFAEARAKNPEPVRPTKQRHGADQSGDGSLIDWLFDDGSDDSGSDGGGD